MLHASFLEHLTERFSSFFENPVQIFDHYPVTGGDINQVFRLVTSKGNFLIKINASLYGLDVFEKEARGLMLLSDAGVLKVPRPLFDGKFHQQIFLVIEYIESGDPGSMFWQNFAEGLARLHLHTQEACGLEFDNYIGRMVQHNQLTVGWPKFFAEQRLLRVAQKAASRKLLYTEEMQLLEAVVKKCESLLPDEKPNLLHGDLWNGNFIVGRDGNVAIFDPAVYYGHREMDIAMTLLFGGFDTSFYEAYNHYYPMESGWKDRIELCQLYPLLIHLLLFGGHYHTSVVSVLKRYA